MKALLVGSRAELRHNLNSDYDYIVASASMKEFVNWMQTSGGFGKPISSYPTRADHYVFKFKDRIVEVEVAYTGTSAMKILDMYGDFPVPSIANTTTMKVIRNAHRYRDIPHFHKNMIALENYYGDIAIGEVWTDILYLRREEYEKTDKAKISLNKSKEEFFSGDGVEYVYEHDSLHRIFAISGTPAYESISKEGCEVASDRDKFDRLPKEIKDNCVIEEALVIAVERGFVNFQDCGIVFDVDYNFELYRKALQKICTTLTSGWFREYASANYMRLCNQDSYHLRFGLRFTDYFLRNINEARKL